MGHGTEVVVDRLADQERADGLDRDVDVVALDALGEGAAAAG